VVAIVMIAACMLGAAQPIVPPGRPARAWWLWIAAELFMFGAAMNVVAHFGDRGVVWFGTPLAALGAACGLAHLVLWHRGAGELSAVGIAADGCAVACRAGG
jgi:hypothetical protein